jgi:hypothetical protein
MKKALLILALVATSASAELEKGPLEYWDISHNRNDSVSVNINAVDDVQQTCEKQSKKRGYNGFPGVKMLACSFWTKHIIGYSCDIYVGKMTNNDTLGHEMRHCLQGSFH